MDCRDRAAAFFAHRFSAGWRAMERYGCGSSRVDFARARARTSHLLRASSRRPDRKSTRLNSSHLVISYAVFCLTKQEQPHRCLDVFDGPGRLELRPDIALGLPFAALEDGLRLGPMQVMPAD